LKRFYYAVWPLCQSLPELLHHQAQVVDILEERLANVPALELGSFMQLSSVLARDLQEDLWPFFHRIFGTLVGRINSVTQAIPGTPSPELTGQLFECLSYLIKYCLPKLSEEHDSMRQYYGQMLGHGTPFVRDLSARALVLLLRRLKPAAFAQHVKRLLKALAGQCRGAVANLSSLDIGEAEGWRDPGAASLATPPPPRLTNIIEGVALLLFYTARGIKGCLHSKGAAKVALPFQVAVPITSDQAKEALAAA
jgi:hypothetical protein